MENMMSVVFVIAYRFEIDIWWSWCNYGDGSRRDNMPDDSLLYQL